MILNKTIKLSTLVEALGILSKYDNNASALVGFLNSDEMTVKIPMSKISEEDKKSLSRLGWDTEYAFPVIQLTSDCIADDWWSE